MLLAGTFEFYARALDDDIAADKLLSVVLCDFACSTSPSVIPMEHLPRCYALQSLMRHTDSTADSPCGG